MAFRGGVGMVGFLDRASTEEGQAGRCMRSNRTGVHSRLRVKPGLPGWDLGTESRASWGLTGAKS